jgi:hypothetical protein
MTLFTIKTEKKIFTTKNSLLNLEDSTKEEEENSNKISNKGNLYITEKKYKKISDKLKITSRTYFKHRNLIKKVKTNCINIFEKLISNCLSIEQSIFSFAKNKKKRDVLRYFKSDISKLRNYFLLKIKMKDLISLFCDFDFNLYKKYIISDKEYKLNFLLNLTWKEFLLYLKNNNQIITNEIENLIKINNKDFDIFFNYILEINYTYDLRPSVDSLYANNLEKIINKSVQLNNEIQRQNDFFNFILNFE